MSTHGKAGAPDEKPAWMQHQERGNLFWLRRMRWLSLTLGRRVSRLLVFAIALYFVLVASSARLAAQAYLARCLGRTVTWLDLYRHFLAFASTIHDRVYLLNDRHELFDIQTVGTDALHKLQAGNQGLLLFGAHLGSFEVLRSLARDQPKLKMAMAMYPENARQINETLAAINPRAMQDIIALGKLDAILAIHGKLEEGTMVGILADRTSGPDQYLTLPFLGAPARFPTGPFRMAAMLRHPVYFMAGLYRGGNRYEVHFELLADFSVEDKRGRDVLVRETLARYVSALERYCQSAPYNWFNFYDFWDLKHRDHA
ncbi:acyl-CoA synthetase [Rhodoferax sp.]|uniref:LpxL/LpxP family acyltransferase n=1 Tax=Rhodoferax sp. TaxID=50421 RepID=UPI00275E6A32|nr:acyl-CoA synthetase [Rhodoferax sp.]